MNQIKIKDLRTPLIIEARNDFSTKMLVIKRMSKKQLIDLIPDPKHFGPAIEPDIQPDAQPCAPALEPSIPAGQLGTAGTIEPAGQLGTAGTKPNNKIKKIKIKKEKVIKEKKIKIKKSHPVSIEQTSSIIDFD